MYWYPYKFINSLNKLKLNSSTNLATWYISPYSGLNNELNNDLISDDRDNQYHYHFTVQYQSIDTYTVMEEKPLYRWDQLACEIGGIISVLIGMSVISVIELIVYVILKVMATYAWYKGLYIIFLPIVECVGILVGILNFHEYFYRPSFL